MGRCDVTLTPSWGTLVQHLTGGHTVKVCGVNERKRSKGGGRREGELFYMDDVSAILETPTFL